MTAADPEQDEQLTTWDWIKVVSWIAVFGVFGLLIFPYWVFNKLKILCGSESSKCTPHETIEWLTSTAIGGVLLVIILVAAIWVYYPLVASYARLVIQNSRMPPTLVWSAALAFVGLWLAYLVAMITADQEETMLTAAPHFQQISQRYHRNASEFDLLASQLEDDSEISELYCDENMVAVTTPQETFYDGENDDYTNKYIPICRFTRKVAAERTSRGVRFPHRFFEVGPLAASSYLEWRRDPPETFGECGSDPFEVERGTCDISINEHWSATYTWEPFCLDSMEGEAGC